MTSTFAELFAPIIAAMRRATIRRQLAHIEYQRSYILNRRENDYEVERLLDRREVILRSELRCL